MEADPADTEEGRHAGPEAEGGHDVTEGRAGVKVLLTKDHTWREEVLLITLFNVLVLDQEPFSNVAITYKDQRYATRARLKDLHLPKPNANFLKRHTEQ